MKETVTFLTLVTKRFPPLARHAHSLVLKKGKLQLNLVNATPCWQFIFDEADLEKGAEQLVAEIVRMMPQPSKNDPKPPTGPRDVA